MKIHSPISLADGEIQRYLMTSMHLQVELKAWNESIVHVEFSGALGLRDFGVRDISGLVELNGPSDLLVSILGRLFEQTPETHEFRVYQFLDNDERPALEVVAKSVAVEL